jgi:hypothetical protein
MVVSFPSHQCSEPIGELEQSADRFSATNALSVLLMTLHFFTLSLLNEPRHAILLTMHISFIYK